MQESHTHLSIPSDADLLGGGSGGELVSFLGDLLSFIFFPPSPTQTSSIFLFSTSCFCAAQHDFGAKAALPV